MLTPRPPLLRHFLFLLFGALILTTLLSLWALHRLRDEQADNLAEIEQIFAAEDKANSIRTQIAATQLEVSLILTGAASGELDEAEIYQRHTGIVDRLANFDSQADTLTTALLANQQPAAEVAAIRETLTAYRDAVIMATDIAAIAPNTARRHLESANASYLNFTVLATRMAERLDRMTIERNREARQRMDDAFVQLASLLGVDLFVLILVAAIFARRFSRKLGTLTEGMLAVAGSQPPGTPMPAVDALVDDGHFGAQARAVLRFRDVLQANLASQQALAELRDGLEDQVAARTAELARATAEAERARAVAESANLAKNQFLSTMSHELRTPLNGTLGHLQLIELHSDDPYVRDCAQRGIRSGLHLSRLISDILDFARIEAGKFSLDPAPFILPEVVFEAVEAGFRDDRQDVEVYFNTDDIPRDTLSGDPLRLKQVLINLVSNALKFTELGEVEIAVIPRQRAAGSVTVEFAIRDTGIGIEPAQLARLFRPFEQADMSITRRFGGSGLGLVISQRLVEMMGGQITVDSQPGIGSRFAFTLTFPVLRAAPEEASDLPIPTPASGSTALPRMQLAGVRILVVDDEAESRQVSRLLLEAEGATVLGVASGAEALDVAREATPPDLILMDMQMPDLNGLETTRRLRAFGITGPIIAVTANASTSDREACLAAGMNDYLSKPVLLAPLLEAIRRARQAAGRPDGNDTPTQGNHIA